MEDDNYRFLDPDLARMEVQRCPQCGELIGIMPGSRDAICHNCGFKDPCCE